jgi:hypothetical protein
MTSVIEQRVIEFVGVGCKRGLAFSAGGSADLILAKTIATGLVRAGCCRVDLAQPLHFSTLSEMRLHSQKGEFHALEPEPGLEPECVLRHHATLPSCSIPECQCGTGLSISALLEWNYGSRYVCATHGDGPISLARRLDGTAPFYEFGVGVDGGGDALTHDDDEADRVVLAGYQSGWPSSTPLLFIAMGLGADGGSKPAEFDDVSLPGWKSCGSQTLDEEFAISLKQELLRLGLWHPNPSTWSKDDPIWGYGLKVPQIISMAIQNEFPFDAPSTHSDLVTFPRRRELKPMSKHLLQEARFFLREVSP